MRLVGGKMPPRKPAPPIRAAQEPEQKSGSRALSAVRVCASCRRTKFPGRGSKADWMLCDWPWTRGWFAYPIEGCPHCAEQPSAGACTKAESGAVKSKAKSALETPKASRLAARLAAVRAAIARRKGGG